MFKFHINNFKTIKFIVIGLLLANATIVNAQGSTFDILHTTNAAQGPGIKITFNGAKYEPAKDLNINNIKSNIKINSEFDFIEQVLSIQRQGASEKYSELWEKKLKFKVLSTYKSKPEEWSYLQNQMQAIQSAKMKGVINYGSSKIIWIEFIFKDKVVQRVYPVKMEDDKLVLTNDLSEDLIFSQLLVLLK